MSTKITQLFLRWYSILDLSYTPKLWRYGAIAAFLWVFSLSLHLVYFHFNRTFSQDQARDILIAENIIDNRQWIIGYGPKASVANFYLPPLYYYLQTFVHLVSSWPLSMSVVISLIESFTPVILFLIFARWIDERVGVIAAIIYTVSPLVLTFSTFMWNPNLIQFAVMASLAATIEYVMTKKRKWILITAGLLTLAFHLHYQSVVVMPFFILVYLPLLFWRKSDWKFYLIGVVIFSLSFSTYLIMELQTQFQNTREIIHYFQSDHARIYEQVTKPQYIWKFIPQFFSRILFPEYAVGSGIRLGRFLFLIILPLVILHSVYTLQQKNKRPADIVRFLLVFYIASVVVMLRAYKGEKVDYYMSTLFMAPAVLIGVGSSYFRKLTLPLVTLGMIGYLHLIAGFYAQKFQTKYDNYSDLTAIFTFINETVKGSETDLIFANPDFTHTVAFGQKKFAQFPSKISDTISSPYVVQFCYTGVNCVPFRDEVCAIDKSVEEIALRYNQLSVYNPQVEYSHGVYTVVISKRIE